MEIKRNWRERDSNPRRRSSTDLQSVAFSRSAISPFPATKPIKNYLPFPGNIFYLFSGRDSWQWDLNPQPADYKSAALPLSYASNYDSITKKSSAL